MTKRAKPTRAWAVYSPKGALASIAMLRSAAIEDAIWNVQWPSLSDWGGLLERGYSVDRILVIKERK